MNSEDEYLYRGTTLGWPGTRMNQFIPRTSTSTDPLVATFFALECMSHGQAIVEIIPKIRVESLIRGSNLVEGGECYSRIECEVALELKPIEIFQYVGCRIDVADAREILWELGFNEVPYLIGSKEALTKDLTTTHDQSYRLDPDQRRDFNRLAFERAT